MYLTPPPCGINGTTTLLPDSGDQETENSVSSFEMAFDFVDENVFYCSYFDYRLNCQLNRYD